MSEKRGRSKNFFKNVGKDATEESFPLVIERNYD